MKKKISPIPVIIYLVMTLLLAAKLDVIRKMYDLSKMPDMSFFLGIGLQPGVLLPITGSILTQFCHFPLLGAILIVLSLAGLTELCKKVFGASLTAYLPAVFVFSFLVGMDYAIYTMRAQGILFSQTIGLSLSVLLVWGWQKTKRFGKLYPVFAVAIGYPLIGVYAILSALIITAESIREKRDTVLTSVSSLFSAVLFPWAYTHFVFTHIDARYTYFAAAPYMDFVKNGLKFIPLGMAALSVIFLGATKGILWRRNTSTFVQILSAMAMSAVIVLFCYKDQNFHIELAMEDAIENNDWKKALRYAAKSEEPTRVIVMYRNIALIYNGQLCDRMFSFPNSGPRINTPGQISQTEVCAPIVFFYNGLINYSTRWAWEMSMMFQRTVERYKYQAKVALFTGQENPALVEKYLEIIGENWFEKKWVEKYRNYLYDKSALMRDEEYQMFLQLNDYEEVKYMSSAIAEDTLLSHFLSQNEPKGVMLDLSIAAAMTLRNTDAFWHYYSQFRKTGRPLPTHISEAAILFAYIERNQALIENVAMDIGPNSAVVRRFQLFSGEASGLSSTEGVQEKFKKKYGDTYWYYCYFTGELMTD